MSNRLNKYNANFENLHHSRAITEGTEIMKMKLALFFSLVALAASAQTNSIHTWTLKTGASFTGDYISSGGWIDAVL
jgi:hypothetical protein